MCKVFVPVYRFKIRNKKCLDLFKIRFIKRRYLPIWKKSLIPCDTFAILNISDSICVVGFHWAQYLTVQTDRSGLLSLEPFRLSPRPTHATSNSTPFSGNADKGSAHVHGTGPVFRLNDPLPRSWSMEAWLLVGGRGGGGEVWEYEALLSVYA